MHTLTVFEVAIYYLGETGRAYAYSTYCTLNRGFIGMSIDTSVFRFSCGSFICACFLPFPSAAVQLLGMNGMPKLTGDESFLYGLHNFLPSYQKDRMAQITMRGW